MCGEAQLTFRCVGKKKYRNYNSMDRLTSAFLLIVLMLAIMGVCAVAPREPFYSDPRTPVSQKVYSWLEAKDFKGLCSSVRPITDPDDDPLEADDKSTPHSATPNEGGTQLVKPAKCAHEQV